jgi:mono/diheme cytochrome c family protein
MTDTEAGSPDKGRLRAWPRWRWLALMALLTTLAVAAYLFRPLPQAAAPALSTLKPSIETGAYLARIGNCAACHSPPGQAPYAGGVAFKTDFGTLYSTNITPDPASGIGTWRFEDFHAAMKHGVRPGGEHLYPAFPYTHFAGIRDDDLASLYLYLKSLPPVAKANRANELRFPFGERRLLYFWKRLLHGDPQRPTRGTAEQARGAYLVNRVAHCGACHTPRGALANPDQARTLQGGSYIDQTARGTYRPWAAIDLTPGETGLARWSRDDIAAYLLTGKNRHAVVHGPMVEVFASTRHLTPADALAIATYLKSLEPGPAPSSFHLFDKGAEEGATIYAVHCGTCHLPDGRGDPILGVSLRGNPVVQAEDPSSLINTVLYGPDLPPPPFSTGRSNMKPFGKRLSDEDVAALATFLRRNFGNKAGAVSAVEVARQR